VARLERWAKMKAKHPIKVFILRVVWCALVGAFIGLLWGSGVFALISRRHGSRRSYWHEMTIDRYTSNVAWFSFYGFLAGIALGVFVGIWALFGPPKDSSREIEKGPNQPSEPTAPDDRGSS
jgi:hypothetical protein